MILEGDVTPEEMKWRTNPVTGKVGILCIDGETTATLNVRRTHTSLPFAIEATPHPAFIPQGACSCRNSRLPPDSPEAS